MNDPLTEEEWRRVIARGETMHVDFKAAMSWDGEARADLTKDIIAMANVQDGGTILVSVAKGDDGAAKIDGLTPEQAASFDPTRICDYIAAYFQPPVQLRIERPEVNGKRLVAIRVSEFDATPMICITDGPEKKPGDVKGKRTFYAGNIIVRTPAAKSEAIRSAEDMHALVRLAVTKTSDKLLGDIQRILDGGIGGRAILVTDTRPYEKERLMWEDALSQREALWKQQWPRKGRFSFIALPDLIIGKQMDHSTMRKLVQQAHTQGAGLTLPNCFENQVTRIANRKEALQGTLDLNEYQELWQLHETGFFADASLLHYVKSSGEVIPFELLIWLVALALRFVQRLYTDLDASRFDYEFRLDGVRDQKLGTFDPARLRITATIELSKTRSLLKARRRFWT